MSIDVTDATFQTEVDRPLHAGARRGRPVGRVVRAVPTLGPILEKVVGETGGKVALAKVDVDANPQVSQAFQVQGIPAVFAMDDGKVVDGFVGAQPEASVRQFVDGLLPTEEEYGAGPPGRRWATRPRCARRSSSSPATRERSWRWPSCSSGGATRPPRPGGAGPARAHPRDGRHPPGGGPGPDRRGRSDGTTSSRELDALLDRVKDDEAARQRFLDLLEVLGPDDPRTAGYRKQLTSRLF